MFIHQCTLHFHKKYLLIKVLKYSMTMSRWSSVLNQSECSDFFVSLFHMWPGTTKPPKSCKKLFSWFHLIMKEEVLLIKMVYYLSKLKLPNPFNLVNEKSWWGRLLVLNCEKESFKVWGYSSMRSKQTTGKSIEGWIKRP